MSETLAIGLEAAGIAAIIGGMVIEIILGADLGYIVITAGSGMIAAGGMIWVKLWKR